MLFRTEGTRLLGGTWLLHGRFPVCSRDSLVHWSEKLVHARRVLDDRRHAGGTMGGTQISSVCWSTSYLQTRCSMRVKSHWLSNDYGRQASAALVGPPDSLRYAADDMMSQSCCANSRRCERGRCASVPSPRNTRRCAIEDLKARHSGSPWGNG